MLYTTNISLGTPPQPFRAVVDLMWNDLFVPSAECRGSHCETKAYYNSSASSSFSKNNTASRCFYGPIVASGHVNNESLTIADLVVPNQPFHELNHYDTVWPDFEHEHFDSVLGLAMDRSMLENPITQNILPSPIKRIVDEGLLDDNIFSILLPEHPGESGNIMFGGYNNDFFTGEPVSHPLFPESTTSWQIEVTSLALGDGYSATTDESLPTWKGLLMSRYPILGFPQKVGSELLKHINVTPSRCFGNFVVDCNSISELPDLTIGFTGQKITLTGEDYISRITSPEGFCPDPVEECVLMIETLPPIPNIPNDTIVLGSTFLKKIYGIFDWDKRTISCRSCHFLWIKY